MYVIFLSISRCSPINQTSSLSHPLSTGQKLENESASVHTPSAYIPQPAEKRKT